VMVFKNKYKTEGSNQPDYRVYFDNGPQKMNVQIPTTESKTQTAPAKEAAAVKTEDIPF
jgi:hypothetical protein